MRNTALSVLAVLRFVFPPIASGLLLWLLTVDDWPLVRFAIFLGYYDALLYGTYPLVYTSRMPPPFAWYLLPIILGLAVFAALSLGILGEALAIGFLLLLMADFHERHMLYFGATSTTLVRDSAAFSLIMLIVLAVFFGLSFYVVIASVGYCAHLLHQASQEFAKLPKPRRFP